MELKKIPAGPNPPQELFVVIEISKGSQNKYEYSEEYGILMLDRVLYTSMHYPFNYGFVPSTLCDDGDPLDCLVISTFPIISNTVVKVRPIGLLEIEDEKGKDEKLIAVPLEKIDPRLSNIKDIDDLPQAIKNEIKHFFEHYKELEPGKWVRIKDWKNRDYALEFIKKVIK
ncbi:MAG: inorganic diphosphatase [Candidatus Micrarchaeia archaeon]